MVQAQNNPGSASQPVDQNGDNDGDDFGDKFKAFAFTYRTPISSGTASMISTFCAVSYTISLYMYVCTD